MSIHGLNHIGSERKGSGSNKFKAFSPEKGEMLPEEFISATHEEIEETLQLAEQAFQLYNKKSSIEKAVFLETIAQEIENLGDELIFRAMAESGLPEGRIRGERGRTTGQLHLFARVLRDGQWLEASIDTAIPDRAPLPKPDIRSMRRGVGPVVVFTASNFPLAFSTAGGDTASALAAGNPVIVKCHEGHPGTNALVSDAIQNAAKKCNMPNGVFSSLQGTGFELGKTLVMHPATKSVAFTGSHNGGMALWKMAAEREEPIPVFAEMGSINPSFILPRYLDNNTQTLAKNMAGSILLGVGQFCTNPGLIVIQNSDNSDEFIETLAQEIEASAPASMLNENVFNQYNQKVGAISTHKGLSLLNTTESNEDIKSKGTVATVSASTFIQNQELHEEVFGPFSLIVTCNDMEEMELVAVSLNGQLTSGLWLENDEHEAARSLFHIMEERVGRIMINNVPTGVEVCHSMHHGGPFPATTDSRFTSVGADAIKRFSRPVCYQNIPESLLPEELKNGNPLQITRRVNGTVSENAI